MKSSATIYPRGDGKVNWEAVFWISFIHLGALAAIPFFSWKALGVCLLLFVIISPLGVTLTYHRLLTHRAFRVPKWFEYTLATIGAFSAQGSPIDWVAGHRFHHRYSDTAKDSHTPRKGFFFSHLGNNLVHGAQTSEELMKYVPDLRGQAYYRFLHRYHVWIALSILPVLYLLGGLPFVLWGGFVRVTLMLHSTWLVNSATHTWGYRSFATNDDSRNCWWVALISSGEGWHNNHHAQPRCAAHGHKWYEFDITYRIIQCFEALGLATAVVKPAK